MLWLFRERHFCWWEMGIWPTRDQIIQTIQSGSVYLYGCGSDTVPFAIFTSVDQVPQQSRIDSDQLACLTIANAPPQPPSVASLQSQLSTLSDSFMAYKRNQPSNINRGVFATGATYNYGDIASFGSPASAYSFASTSPLTGTASGNPASDNSNANWMLLASAGATGSQGTQGSTGTTGAAGTNAAANDATTTLSATANPIASPAAGTYRYIVTYLAAASGAISDKLPARQTGLGTIIIKNETSYNVTIAPPTGGTIDNGQLATYLISAGDTAVFTADPASATSWMAT